MGDRLKPASLLHPLVENAVLDHFRIDSGVVKNAGDAVYEVGLRYNKTFQRLAHALACKTSRYEVEAGIRFSFAYKGWTFYTIHKQPMSESQRIAL